MKRINFFKYCILMFAAVAFISFTACSDDDDDDDNGEDPVFVEDGFYIKGAGTALPELTFNGLLRAAVNEADGNNDRAGLYEIFIAVKAGAEGFNILEIAGGDEIVYGPGSDFAEVGEDDIHVEEPQLGFWRGSMAETSTPFTVTEDGLYHVAFDQELNTVVIAFVHWGVIGNATPGGWSGSTDLTSSDFDLETITFSDNVAMIPGQFKFRYSNGWKAFFDPPDNTISVNANFGKAINDLEPGGANIALEASGMYDITIKWELGKMHVANMTRTGDVDIDYSDTPVGLIGEGVLVDGDPHNWDGTVFHHLPDVDGSKFIWTFASVELAANIGFKFREEEGWDGINLGFSEVDIVGPDADNFVDIDGNLATTVAGDYELILDFDKDTESFTLSATAL